MKKIYLKNKTVNMRGKGTTTLLLSNDGLGNTYRTVEEYKKLTGEGLNNKLEKTLSKLNIQKGGKQQNIKFSI